MRRRARSYLALFVLALAAGLLTPSRAEACDCGGTSLEDAVTSSDAIFEGAYLRQLLVSPIQDSEVVVRVERAWKGVNPGDEVTLQAFTSNCDVAPGAGSRTTLLFARRVPSTSARHRFHAHQCSQPSFDPHASLAERDQRIDQALRATTTSVVAPSVASPPPAPSGGCAVSTAPSSLLLVAAALWSLLRPRPRRPRRAA